MSEHAVEVVLRLLRAVDAAGVLVHRVVVVDERGILAIADNVIQGIWWAVFTARRTVFFLAILQNFYINEQLMKNFQWDYVSWYK